MVNITDSTCDFGLAYTDEGCTRTLASYNPSAYHTVQAVYLALGGVSVIASVILYVRSVKHEGALLQQYSFLFCCYGAVTMVIRGADPLSYGYVIPRPISAFLADTCTAALYSVYIMALGYWATIIQRGAAVTDKPPHLVCLESIAIAVVWTFQVLYDMCLFLSKGFNPQGLVYMQLTVSACMLGIISTVFLIYGLRVLSRLQQYERQLKLRIPSVRSNRMMSNRSFDMNMSDDEGDTPVMRDRKAHPRPQEGHAAKIKKILFVVETCSIVVVAAQMYMAIARTNDNPVELSCANGKHCELVECSVNVLHVFQIVCIWVILWTFRKIQKKAVVPRPHRVA
uniref:THH1/TOM1/TOM3 domain-containing protein n=1 Tax=Peronospora matthiolae TaxID=2874970 RepID=A0AAV1TQT4_9STRA